MTPKEAQLYAASWGSTLNFDDPGIAMYGLDVDCRPQTEDHRQRILSHMRTCRLDVVAKPHEYDKDELDKLDTFVEFITHRALH